MESTAATLVHSPSPPPKVLKDENGALIFDSNLMRKEAIIPKEFVWPSNDLVTTAQEELHEPLVDLGVMINGGDDAAAIASAAELVREACVKHGFFQVTNHGVSQDLIDAAYREVDSIFQLPLNRKLGARRKPGGVSGYSGAHADRYSTKLPWKETFSFQYDHSNKSESQIVDYFKSVLGEDLQQSG